MKKITFLLIILTSTFGFSQSLPIDFSDPLDNNFVGAGGSVFSSAFSPTDGSNPVGKIVGGTDQWNSRIDLALGTYIDMTTANKTFTFKFYSTEAVVMNGLFQINFEKDGGYAIEKTFSTNGQIGWQTITLDFTTATNAYPNGSLSVVYGKYAGLSVFTNFGDNGTSTYYVDDIAGAANGIVVPTSPAPTDAPTAPNAATVDVISLFSDAYTNIAATWNPGWGQTTLVVDETIASNTVKKYSNFNFSGIEPGTPINASGMTHFNLNYWTSDATTLRIALVDYRGDGTWGNDNIEVGIDKPLTTNTWGTISIPLTDYTTINTTMILSDIGQIVLAKTGGTNPVYLDNIYFSKDNSASLDDLVKYNFSMYPNPAKDVINLRATSSFDFIEVYDLTGRVVIKEIPNSNIKALHVSSLSKGIYVVKVGIEGVVGSTKFLKQ